MDVRHDEQPQPAGTRPSDDAMPHAYALLKAWEVQNKAYSEFVNTLSVCFVKSLLLWGLSWTMPNALHRLELEDIFHDDAHMRLSRRAAAQEDSEDLLHNSGARRMVETQLMGGDCHRPGVAPPLETFAAPFSSLRERAELTEAAIIDPMMEAEPANGDLVEEWERWRQGATDPRL